jgi:hypothetical protein
MVLHNTGIPPPHYMAQQPRKPLVLFQFVSVQLYEAASSRYETIKTKYHNKLKEENDIKIHTLT